LLIDFLKGLAIGIGAIAPGISGGALAVMLGVYESITDALANLFEGFWKKVKDFFFLGLGGVVGVLAFSNVINYLFRHYELEVKYLFIGLMLGTFPNLRKQANKEGFQKSYLIPFVIVLALAVFLAVLEKIGTEGAAAGMPGFLSLVFYGIVIGFGTIIPGISSSVILMYLGAYGLMMEGISRLKPAVLIPAGIGFVLSVLLFAKLINWLFRKAYGYTFYAVLGLTAGSLISVFPGFGFTISHIIGYILLIAGTIISYLLSNLENKGQIKFRIF